MAENRRMGGKRVNREKLRAVLNEAVQSRSFCRCQFHYGNLYRNYIPVMAGEKIFMSAREHDFTLDGFSIRRIRDLKKLKVKNDQYARILRLEAKPEEMQIPEMELSSWQAVFARLEKMKTPVWIKSESMWEREEVSWMGRVQMACRHDVYLRTFDDEGKWAEEDTLIPYSEITSVTFGSRYMLLFARYGEPFPEDRPVTDGAEAEAQGTPPAPRGTDEA